MTEDAQAPPGPVDVRSNGPSHAESFESYTDRLARIVEELERGDLPLERSLALFEEGVSLARRARAQIERAEKRVEELLAFDPQGRPVTRPLATDASQATSAAVEGDASAARGPR